MNIGLRLDVHLTAYIKCAYVQKRVQIVKHMAKNQKPHPHIKHVNRSNYIIVQMKKCPTSPATYLQNIYNSV